jgi:endonuclease V-like protein UPF0215 family
MPKKRFSNLIGFDDAPFVRNNSGPVPIVGAVYAGLRFDGVLIDRITRDGRDATETLVNMVSQSKFSGHAQLIMLQGVTMAGFNVVDVAQLHGQLGLPILAIARHRPDMTAIRETLLTRISGGSEKWALIEQLGPMEPVGNVFVQRVGLSLDQTAATLERFAIHSHIPEPIRTAHLIAGALVEGQSRGNP